MKITIKTQKSTKVVSLTTSEVEQIKSTENYAKINNVLIAKAQAKLMRATYFKNAFWYECLILAIAALATTIAFDYFISSTGREGLFPGGMGAITRFLSVVTFPNNKQYQSSFYFVYYLALSFPLMIFSYFKLGIKFTLSTLLYISFSIAFDQLLMHIPVINPSEWHLIIDYQLIAAIPGAWSSTVWLFVFALFGGILLGWSYALTYKIGSSSGGTDFITVWFSKKKNKDIGTINRNVNFIILFIVIILNTVLISPSEMDESIKYSALNDINIDDLNNQTSGMGHNLSSWFNDNRGVGILDWVPPSLNYPEAVSNYKQQLLMSAAADSNFSGYTTGLINLIRFKFIFGPSLFASAILVVVQSIAINAVYPKNVKRTIVITTAKSNEIIKFLFASGYKNDVLIKDVEAAHYDKDNIKLKTITFIIPLMNWKIVEKGIMHLDENMTINIMMTKAVKGAFIAELKDERQREFIQEKLMQDKKAMVKIEKESIYKTWKRQQIK